MLVQAQLQLRLFPDDPPTDPDSAAMALFLETECGNRCARHVPGRPAWECPGFAIEGGYLLCAGYRQEPE